MGDERRDLARLAGEYAEQGVDLYELLGVDALTAKEDIHRAWRKRSLKYHPDKVGAQFNGAKWELFERARDVLADADARAAYDGALKARLLLRQEREAMDRQRQRFADDLEAREQAALRLRDERARRERDALHEERHRLAEAQRLRVAEQARQAEAAQELADLEEARRRLRDKRDEKARRKLARHSIKASVPLPASATTGPANGIVDVPGHYLVDLSDASKPYWELVCDKLRAVQAARNLGKGSPTAEQLRAAHETVDDMRRKISEAEVRYQHEVAGL